VRPLCDVFVLARFGWWLKTRAANAAGPEAAFVRVADNPSRTYLTWTALTISALLVVGVVVLVIAYLMSGQ
jgi:hypothetical protein